MQCATGDEFHAQFFAFRKTWNRLSYIRFSHQLTSRLSKPSIEHFRCLAFQVLYFAWKYLHATLVWVFSMRDTTVFGPVFVWTYEKYIPLRFSTRTSTTNKHVNKTFAVLATPCGVHTAHGRSIHAEWANRIFPLNWQDYYLVNFKAIFEGLGLRV